MAVLKPFFLEDIIASKTILKADSGKIFFLSSAEMAAENVLTISSGVVGGNETVSIGATTYKYVASPSAANDIDIGTTNTISLANLIAAINLDAGEGTKYGTGTVINPDVIAEVFGSDKMAVHAKRAGTQGNNISVAETLTLGSWADPTFLANGLDTPKTADREFIITLPQDDVDGGNYEFAFRDNGRSQDVSNQDYFTSWTISSGLAKPFIVTSNSLANNPYNSRVVLNTKGATTEGVKLGGRINDGPEGTVLNYESGVSIEFVLWGGTWYSTPPFGSGFYGIGDFPA